MRDGMHDRVEAEEAMHQGLQLLHANFAVFDELDRRTRELTIEPRSSLAGDRDAANYSSTPDQVRASVGTALDHLLTLRLVVERGHALTAMAPYTLVRSAYEACGTAMWLLHPRSRDERVLRALQLTYDARRQVRSVYTDTGIPDQGFDRARSTVEQMRDTRPRLRGKDLRPATITNRLLEVDKLFPGTSMRPIVLWRTASGMAHGNPAMMLQVLDRAQMTPAAHGGADFSVTSSAAHLAVFYDDALQMIAAVLDLYERRNRARAAPEPYTWEHLSEGQISMPNSGKNSIGFNHPPPATS